MIGFLIIYIAINLFDFIVIHSAMNDVIRRIHPEYKHFKLFMIATPYVLWCKLNMKTWCKIVTVILVTICTLPSIMLKSLIYVIPEIIIHRKGK